MRGLRWAYGFSVGVAFWPGLLSAAVAPRWALIAVGTPFLGWVEPRALDLRIALSLWGLILYAGVSLLWTPDVLTGMHEVMHLLILALVIYVAASIETVEPILEGLAWAVGISSLLTIPQALGWSPVEQLGPPAGLFGNRMVLGELCTPLLVWCAVAKRISLGLLFLPAMALCGSRVGLVALLAGMFFFRPRRASVAAAIAIVAAGVAIFSLQPYKLTSLIERLDIWEATVMWLTPFGNGIGAFTAHYPRYEYAHSDLLQAIYELGAGSVFLAAVFWFAARRTWRNHAVLAALAVEVVLSFPLHLPTTTLLAGLLIGDMGRVRVAVRDERDESRDPGLAFAGRAGA